jgi:CheY-like chemotaxis protein
MIDATRFKQVLLNLLSNAIKYNHADGTVILKAEQTPGGWLRVSVTDTGPGIPAEKQDELFRPFSRLGQEGSDIQGTDIGLTISKKLMENMDGRVGFESTFGLGSTFWIEAPLAEENAVVLKLASRTGGDTVETSAGTLLYVEDNPANLKLMQAIIELMPGVTMLSAHTGELGLELAAAHRPNVIIMDINLPGIDGFDAVELLRKSDATKDIPVIALTARALPRDKERGIKAGFHSYLTKPIQIGELMAVLEDILPAA